MHQISVFTITGKFLKVCWYFFYNRVRWKHRFQQGYVLCISIFSHVNLVGLCIFFPVQMSNVWLILWISFKSIFWGHQFSKSKQIKCGWKCTQIKKIYFDSLSHCEMSHHSAVLQLLSIKFPKWALKNQNSPKLTNV